MRGPAMGAANLAVCIGPILGRWVALRNGSYQWVFWILVIFGGSALVMVAFLSPETARNLVGDGSRKVSRWEKTLWINPFVRLRKHAAQAHDWKCQAPAQI